MKGTKQGLRTHKKLLTQSAIVLMVGLLWSCAVFTPPERQDTAGNLPPNFSLYSPSQPPANEWWTHFDSPELGRLITMAMGQNFSIREAKARLDQARAVAIKSGAQRLPQLGYEASAAAGRSKTELLGERSIEEYSLGLSATYEIDLWDRIGSQRKAALLDESAAEQDLYTAGMTISAEVAQRWIDIIAQRMEKDILAKQLETNQTLQELVDLRFRKGMVSALDVYQQKQAVASVNASVPLVQLQETQLTHQLAYLLGRSPQSDLKIETHDLPTLKAPPPIGIPADLLANRPDVRAAGLRLQGADWLVAAARADRLPALRLTAGAAYAGEDFGNLFDNWLLNLVGSLTGPIFDGHRRKAEVMRTRAVAEERVAVYGRTVFTAIREVEDLLAQEEKHREHLTALEQQLQVSRNALREAGERYTRGLNDYLPVLTQLLSTQRLERDTLQMKRQLIADRIGLYRSLGGSWPEDLLSLDTPGATQKKEN